LFSPSTGVAMSIEAQRVNPFELRRRLMNPPNAVVDRPIDLRAGRPAPSGPLTTPPAAVVKPVRGGSPHPCDTHETLLATGRHLGLAILRGRRARNAPLGEAGRGVSFPLILAIVADEFKVSTAEIIADGRMQYIVRPRQVVAYLARTVAKMSLPKIGRLLARDHTTAYSSINKIQRLVDRDPDFARRIQTIRREILEYGGE
jgi:hypothetical protein